MTKPHDPAAPAVLPEGAEGPSNYVTTNTVDATKFCPICGNSRALPGLAPHCADWHQTHFGSAPAAPLSRDTGGAPSEASQEVEWITAALDHYANLLPKPFDAEGRRKFDVSLAEDHRNVARLEAARIGLRRLSRRALPTPDTEEAP